MPANGRSLQELQEMFRRIYHGRNIKLYSPAELLLKVFCQASKITESFRHEDHDGIGVPLARAFGWLFAFVNSQNINWAEAVFDKYHGSCPYCGKKCKCICISCETKPRKYRRNNGARMPESVSDWQQMFFRIYGEVNKVAGREKCWQHFVEELGEVGDAFILGQPQELRHELADTFAWLVAFCNRSKIDIAQVIFDNYPNECDVCHSMKCKCPKV